MSRADDEIASRLFRAGVAANEPSAMRELRRVLRLHDGNQTLAAEYMGISRRTLVGWGKSFPHVKRMLRGGWLP